MNRSLIALLAAVFPLLAGAESLKTAADAYVQAAGRAPAVAIARITPDAAERAVSGPDSINEHTLFEIGSITKVFTGILLAELVANDVVTLDTHIGELLDGVRTLDPEVATITLRELATHSSGLPRLPMNARMLMQLFTQPADPYRGLSREILFDDLAAVRSDQLDSRGQPHYSNFGMAILGRLLELAANESYENLLRERVLVPLGLAGMDFIDQRLDDPALVRGHRNNLRPTRHWHLATYAPAGGLVGSLAHLERFLVAAMQAEPGSALAISLEESLGWARTERNGRQLIWHNGQTGGFHAFLGFEPETARGVVILSNASNSTSEFAIDLLDGSAEPSRPDPGWVMLGFTLLLLPLGAVLLFGFMQKPDSRLHGIDALLASVFTLALILKLGAWTHVPILLWYLVAIGTAALAVPAMSRLATAPWAPQKRPWATTGKVFSVVTYLALAAWVVLRL